MSKTINQEILEVLQEEKRRKNELWIPAIAIKKYPGYKIGNTKKIAPMSLHKDELQYPGAKQYCGMSRIILSKRTNAHEDEFETQIITIEKNIIVYQMNAQQLGQYLIKHNYLGIKTRPNLISAKTDLTNIGLSDASISWAVNTVYKAGNKIGWIYIPDILKLPIQKGYILAYIYKNPDNN